MTTRKQSCVVIARTIQGKSVPAIAADPVRFHCTTLGPDEHTLLLRGLE